MRARTRPFPLLAALLLTPVFPAVAAGPQLLQTRGEIAEASLRSVDATGCILTEVSVVTDKERRHQPPGRPSSSAWVNVFVVQSDLCGGGGDDEEGGPLLFGYGIKDLAPGELKIRGNLGAATLKTTVDVSGDREIFPVALDLVWKGKGPVFETSETSESTTPEGLRVITRQEARRRAAALSGGLSLLGEDLDAATGAGALTETRSGTVTR
jgi:hypothetical protein